MQKRSHANCAQASRNNRFAFILMALHLPHTKCSPAKRSAIFRKYPGANPSRRWDIVEIKTLCVRIAEDIRASYTIAYTPPQPEQHTVPRKVRLVASAPEVGKLKVRTRTSYILGDR